MHPLEALFMAPFCLPASQSAIALDAAAAFTEISVQAMYRCVPSMVIRHAGQQPGERGRHSPLRERTRGNKMEGKTAILTRTSCLQSPGKREGVLLCRPSEAHKASKNTTSKNTEVTPRLVKNSPREAPFPHPPPLFLPANSQWESKWLPPPRTCTQQMFL